METGTCPLGEEKSEFSSSHDSSHAGRQFKSDSARPPDQVSSSLQKKHRSLAGEGTGVTMKLVGGLHGERRTATQLASESHSHGAGERS